MIQQTSLLAYANVEHTLGEKQQVVYLAIESLGSATNSEIAQELEWSINRVTPRTNELVKYNEVIEDEKRPCKVTGSKAIAWKIK